MSTATSKVMSEYSLVTFDVLGKTYIKQPSEATAFAEALNISAKRLLAIPNIAAFQFRNVVACRTLLLNNNTDSKTRITNGSVVVDTQNSNMTHDLNVCLVRGPFTTLQFIQMMQFKPGISADEWGAHLHQFAYTQPESKL